MYNPQQLGMDVQYIHYVTMICVICHPTDDQDSYDMQVLDMAGT